MKIRIPTIRAAEFSAKPDTKEVGATGMTFGSMGRLQQQEYLYDLTGASGYRIYERMRRSDPKIVGLRRALDLPVTRATWEVEPANDSARAKEIAEFVGECLFEGLDKSWPEQLQEFLLYQDFGYAPFEKVWKLEDGKVKLKRFGFIPPSTISDIFVVNREVDAIEQQTADRGVVTIPGKKLVWFVNRKEGDNFRGIPMLRAMYRPWFNKERAEILLLVMAERMGGWLKFVSPDGATEDDMAAAEEIGREFRINETMYMVLPPRWEATVESSTGMTLTDLQNYIKYCDEQIDAAALAQVLDLGTSAEGSRALGRTMGEIFDESVQSTGQYVCDVANKNLGVIDELVAYNYADWKENKPRLVIGKVEKMDIKNWSLGFQALSTAGMLFGEKTFGYIREEAGLPEEEELDKLAEKILKKKAENEAEKAKPQPPQIPGQTAVKPRGKGPYVPPGEGDYNPTKGDVNEQPED